MKRTTFLRLILAAVAALTVTGAFGQSYPTRPVRVVIPFPPGGTLDTLGRALAQRLSEQMGQQFVVENKPGGNGIIGADAVAKAPADGYTLLFNASTFVTAPMTMKQVPYGVVQDFTPVALVAKAPLSVTIAKDLPITDIKSLIAYAKGKNGTMTFAVGSIGSAGHLATELLKRAGGMIERAQVADAQRPRGVDQRVGVRARARRGDRLRAVGQVDRVRVELRPGNRRRHAVEPVDHAAEREQAFRNRAADPGAAAGDDDLQPCDRVACEDLTRHVCCRR
jgi:Tripartite tricarboxylate transporter family receptor